MSRGLSVHVFKNALVPSSQATQPPPVPKYEPAQTRPPTSSGGLWNRQLSQATRSESDRKQPPLAPSQDRRLVQVPQPGSQPWPVDTKYAKSQSKGFLIHPSAQNDIYIYERSILSTDDTLTSSPSSDSSSDSDLFPDNTMAMARLEISSTRASSSTETLESTLYVAGANLTSQARGAITGGGGAVPSLPRPPLAITAPPSLSRSTSTRPTDNVLPARPVIPLARAEGYRTRTTSISHAPHPVQFSNVANNLSESDSDTLFSDGEADNMVVDMMGASHSWAMAANIAAYSGRSATPFRSDQRVPSSGMRTRRESIEGPARAPPLPQYRDEGRMEDPSHPRAPPGLYGAVATPPDAQHAGPSQSPPRGAAVSSSPSGPSAVNTSPGGAALRAQQQHQTQVGIPTSGSPPQAARTSSARAPETPTRSEMVASVPSASPPSSSPQRRNSQPSPTQSAPALAEGVVVISAAKRSVRWTEDLVCPSPVPPELRRKGWFNRRGDQLWTNDGHFKSPEPGQEFPPDLAYYPEPNTGWMNEEGLRIDMQHRRIEKRPLRSALKQSRNTV
ncbi:hypothetical protein BC628DRAFT_1321544 [Trametes gibbosa]|nr:hypothetical protein BC628DRAFT_1321544 [Trametes gibbosa]